MAAKGRFLGCLDVRLDVQASGDFYTLACGAGSKGINEGIIDSSKAYINLDEKSRRQEFDAALRPCLLAFDSLQSTIYRKSSTSDFRRYRTISDDIIDRD